MKWPPLSKFISPDDALAIAGTGLVLAGAWSLSYPALSIALGSILLLFMAVRLLR